MTRAQSLDPLGGRNRLIVDGSNQRGHRLEPVPEETVTAGLRALVPAGIEVHVVFDTDPPVGSGTLRAASGVTIHHARAAGADDAIVRLTAHAADRTLVVTDDSELRRRVMELGARAVRNEWLRERRKRGRPVASSIGRRQAAELRPDGDSPDEAGDAPSWQPGPAARPRNAAIRAASRSGADAVQQSAPPGLVRKIL